MERYRGVEVVHHGGTVIGGSCQMLTVPAHGLDVIILANGAAVSPSELAWRVIDTVLGEENLPLPPERGAASADYPGLAGALYAAPAEAMVIGFGDAAGRLGLMVHNSPPLPLRVEEGALCLDFRNSVTGPYRVELADTDPAAAAAPACLTLIDGGTRRRLERLPPAPPLHQAGAALVGHYACADLAAQAEIAFEGEALVLRLASPFGPNRLLLTACAPDLFSWKFSGALAALGGTLRVECAGDGESISGLRLDSLRTRRLYFARLGEPA